MKTFENGRALLYLTIWKDLGLGVGCKGRMKMISVKDDEKVNLLWHAL
jgi:hypothetical protein